MNKENCSKYSEVTLFIIHRYFINVHGFIILENGTPVSLHMRQVFFGRLKIERIGKMPSEPMGTTDYDIVKSVRWGGEEGEEGRLLK